MWELIRANKRRSIVLLAVMLLLMLSLGFVIGAALMPGGGSHATLRYDADGISLTNLAAILPGGLIGMLVAFLIWTIQAAVAYFQGDSILLSLSRARPIEKSDHPQLFNVVEEMTIASSLSQMPKIYVIDDMAMNAFATGRSPETASVAVTAGLLARLNRDELQGVVAHEIAHIVNRDVLFMTMISIMAGTIVLLSEAVLRMFRFGVHGTSARYRGNKKGGNQAQILLLVIALVFAIVAPLLAQIIYFTVSRKREYLADAGAAVFTRYPEGLASALEQLGGDSHQLRVSKATAPMYIVNPLGAKGMKAASLFSTHPPIAERVQILRSLAGGVSYAGYQTAYGRIHGRGKLVPPSGLQQKAVNLRDPNAGPLPETPAKRKQYRDAGDLARNLNGFLFLPCTCGAHIKLPPDFKGEQVICPRCNLALAVPRNPAAAQPGRPASRKRDIPKATPRTGETVELKRDPGAWQSLPCPCGAVKNVGPSFELPQVSCNACGRTLRLV